MKGVYGDCTNLDVCCIDLGERERMELTDDDQVIPLFRRASQLALLWLASPCPQLRSL